jgi:hypothetical protein
MSVPTMTEVQAPTPLISLPRAILVTLGVILVATAIPYLLEVALTVLVNAIYPNPVVPAFGQVFSVLAPATDSVAPAALGGVFWLALLRLGRRGTRRVWLETLGLGALFFSLTLLVVGVVTFYGDLATTPSAAQVLGSPFQIVSATASVPWVMLVLAALALLYSALGLGFAVLLAPRGDARAALAPKGGGGRHFALVYSVASVIMLALAVLTPIFFTLATSPALTNGTSTPTPIADGILFTWQFVLPSAITAIVGAAGVVRAARQGAA